MTSPVPFLILSPHLDDAVFSCGGLLSENPGSVVATVFAGWPPDSDNPGKWDVACGFSSAQQATETRRDEDRHALTLLGARWDHGPVLDSQYRPRLSDRRQFTRRYVERVIAKYDPATVMIPLGLKHPDHIEVRNQALEVYKSRRSGPPWFVYTDLPYGEEWPELIERAESELEAEGFMRHRYETSLDTDFEHKLQAVECYASQTALLFESSALGSVPTISVRASFRRLHRLRRLLHRGTVFSYSQIVSESYGQLQAT